MKRPIEAGEWIGVDLDGTLAIWLGWSVGIGGPVPRMVARVLAALAAGIEVRIFTARVWPGGQSAEALAEQIALVQAWSQEHLGVVLPITCEKDWKMYQLWDDRCRQVIENEGLFIEEVLLGSVHVLAVNDYPAAVYTDPQRAVAHSQELNDAEQARENAWRSSQSGYMARRRRFYHLHPGPLNPATAAELVR
jgi:hypothetical protein